jgi:hypothetical protein
MSHKGDFKMFEIGESVNILCTIDFHYIEVFNDNRKEIKRTFEIKPHYPPLKGKITGATYKFLGTYDPGSKGYDYDGNYDNESPYLYVDSSVFVYTVKLGLMNLNLYVLPEHIINCTEKFKFPIKHTNITPLTTEQRKDLSKWSKDYPRDVKGRWAKIPKMVKVN